MQSPNLLKINSFLTTLLNSSLYLSLLDPCKLIQGNVIHLSKAMINFYIVLKDIEQSTIVYSCWQSLQDSTVMKERLSYIQNIPCFNSHKFIALLRIVYPYPTLQTHVWSMGVYNLEGLSITWVVKLSPLINFFIVCCGQM